MDGVVTLEVRAARGISAVMIFLLFACSSAFGEKGKVPQNFDEAWVLWRNTVDDITETGKQGKCSDPKAREALANRIKQAISQLEQFARAEGIKVMTQPIFDKFGKVLTPGLNAILKRPPSQFSHPEDVYKFTNFWIGNLDYLLKKIISMGCPPPGQQAGQPGTPGGPSDTPTSSPTTSTEAKPKCLTPATIESFQAELKSLWEKAPLGSETYSQEDLMNRIGDISAQASDLGQEIKQVSEDPSKTPQGEHPGAWLDKLKKRKEKFDEDLKTLQKMLELKIKLDNLMSYNLCPEWLIPERPFTETMALVSGTDNEAWCTYGDGIEMYTPLTETDESGHPLAVELSGAAALPVAGQVASQAPQPSQETATRSEPTPETPKPPETATPSEPTPETPKTTEPLPPNSGDAGDHREAAGGADKSDTRHDLRQGQGVRYSKGNQQAIPSRTRW